MNTMIDMAKHMYTAILSNGTINGALISSHSSPICPAMLAVAPGNDSGMKLLAETSAIFFSLQTEDSLKKIGKSIDLYYLPPLLSIFIGLNYNVG